MASNTERNIIIDVQTKTTKAINDIKSLNKQITALQKQNKGFKETTRSVQQMSRSFASLASRVAKLAVIYGGFTALKDTITTFATFEQSIKRLGVISDATSKQLTGLQNHAEELGKSTIYTASQVGDAMNEMAMSGLSVSQINKSIGATLDLASVGMLSLKDSATLTTEAMHGFGLKAEDVGMITDVMTEGATKSSQTVLDLGEAYSKVASVATAFGNSIQETTVPLELLANAGRRGAEAGRQLKIILTRLAGNPRAKQYIDKLGVSMYDANGKLLPFVEQLRVLKTKLDTLDTKTKNMYLGRIFGGDAVASGIILLKTLDQYDTKLKELNESYGIAGKKAKEMIDTLQGAYKTLISAFQGLAINIGETLAPKLKQITDDASHFVRTLDKKEVENFGKQLGDLATQLFQLGKVIVETMGYASHLLAVVSNTTGMSSGWVALTAFIGLKYMSAIKTATTATIEFVGILTASPIGLALTAIGTAFTGVLYFINKAKQGFKEYDNELQKINKTSKDFSDTIHNVRKALHSTSRASVTSAMKAVAQSTDNLKAQIRDANDEIKSLQNRVYVTDAQQKRIDRLKGLVQNLTHDLDINKQATEKLRLKGIELTKARIAEIKKINETRDSLHQLGDAERFLTEAEQKALDKSIAMLGKRQATHENTLATMLRREQNYTAQLEKLETELAQIRKKYADERATLNIDTENRINDLKALGLGNVAKYNDAQRRSDEALANSKKALAEGNLVVAKKYLAEYNNLIRVSAGQEIKENNVVKVTRQQTLQEAIKDEKAGAKISLAIINENEKREKEAIRAKIEAKQLEIQVVKVQITLQQTMINQLGEMIARPKGIKFKADLTEFNASMKLIDKQLANLEKTKRKLNITGDTKPAKKDIEKFQKETDKITAKMVVSADTTKAYRDSKKLKTKLEKDKPKVEPTLVTKEAKLQYINFVRAIEGKKPLTTIKVDNTAVEQAKKFNAQTTYSTHIIYTKTIQQHATGGFIRRTGALSGYGGGDRVRTLLEDGEFIVRKEAVRKLGVARLQEVNQGKIPRFATGGLVLTKRDASVLKEIANNTLSEGNGNSGLDSSSWAGLIKSLKDILEKELPPSFRKAFQGILDEVKQKSTAYSNNISSQTNSIKSLQNSVLGKELTQDEYKSYEANLLGKQNALAKTNSAMPENVDKYSSKVAEEQLALKKYLDEVDYYKKDILDKYDKLGAKPSYELESSYDLRKLKNYDNTLKSIKFVNLSEANTLLKKAMVEQAQINSAYHNTRYGNALPSGGLYQSPASAFVDDRGRTITYHNQDYADYLNKKKLPKFQRGGFLGGYGGGDRVPLLAEDGEFIVRKEAVRHLGLDMMNNLNNLKLPKFQTGGYVGVANNPTTISREVNINFKDQNGGNMTTTTDEQTAYQIEKYFKRFA